MRQLLPLLMHVGKQLVAVPAIQEVSRYSTRGGSSGNLHYIHLCTKWNKAEPTLALKPRGDVTRNHKTGVPVAPKIGHVYVSAKNI